MSPATTDPNADLIGFTFTDDNGRLWQVTGTWPVNEAYVVCNHTSRGRPAPSTLRVAEQVRVARTLRRAAANLERDARDALRQTEPKCECRGIGHTRECSRGREARELEGDEFPSWLPEAIRLLETCERCGGRLSGTYCVECRDFVPSRLRRMGWNLEADARELEGLLDVEPAPPRASAGGVDV